MIPARTQTARDSRWGSRPGAGLLPPRSEADGGRDAASGGSGWGGSARWACPLIARVTVNLNVKEGNLMPQTTVRAVVELACTHVPAARVAEITGLDPAEVSRWRNGRREPRVDRFLGCLGRLVQALPELAEELSAVTGLPLAALAPTPPPAAPGNVVDLAAWRARRAA